MLPAGASPASPPPLRIGLDRFFRHSTTLLVSCDRAFTVKDTQTGAILLHGEPGTIYQTTPSAQGLTVARMTPDAPPTALTGPLMAQPSAGGLLKIARLDNRPRTSLRLPWRRYHGTLTIRREPDDTLRVINTVDVEPYLYGVLPAEIGGHAPLEALKAQAVAARTFALKNRGRFEVRRLRPGRHDAERGISGRGRGDAPSPTPPWTRRAARSSPTGRRSLTPPIPPTAAA